MITNFKESKANIRGLFRKTQGGFVWVATGLNPLKKNREATGLNPLKKRMKTELTLENQW